MPYLVRDLSMMSATSCNRYPSLCEFGRANMLIDQDDANVFSMLCESIKGRFNRRSVGLAIYD